MRGVGCQPRASPTHKRILFNFCGLVIGEFENSRFVLQRVCLKFLVHACVSYKFSVSQSPELHHSGTNQQVLSANTSIGKVTQSVAINMPPHIESEQAWDVSLQSNEPLHEKVDEQSVASEVCRTRHGGNVVWFKEVTSFREILPLSELTDEDISTVWYSEEEYAEIKKHVTETIKLAADGNCLDDDNDFCMRGLEGRTKFGARRRKNNKARALDAVWSTQVALWKQKLDDPLVIAAAYKPHSTNAKYPAIAVAHNDERFVKENVNAISMVCD
jgi:hypothetical protein